MYGADVLMDVLEVSSPVDYLKKDESKGNRHYSSQVRLQCFVGI